jgi:hypothetical protein
MLKVRNLFPRYWEATSLKKMAQHRTLPSQSRIPVAALGGFATICRETVSPSFCRRAFRDPLYTAVRNVSAFHLPSSGRDWLGFAPNYSPAADGGSAAAYRLATAALSLFASAVRP